MRGCAIFVAVLAAALSAGAQCTDNTTDTDGLQSLLTAGGANYTLQLCAGKVYNLSLPLNFTATEQEISTEGYPTDDTRATLLVGGFNVTSAIQATDQGRDGCKLRNIQINGNRGDNPIYTAPSANIEMGGANSNQLIEYVKSYDPRGWSCMHIAEGQFNCNNMTIQHNDIGPCGSESFQQWSDGISLSCMSSLVQNNTIVDATDGGIVVFGAPFSIVRNNTIHVKTRTLLGGINMVDVLPWKPDGNYSHTVVENNIIMGGFATDYGNATLGTNNASAIIKMGIAIGPRAWFNEQYGTNQSMGGTVQNNVLSGAFAFGIGVSSARNFIIQNNSFTGNVTFSGSSGPNCTTGDQTPHPPTALLVESTSTENLTISYPGPFDTDSSDSSSQGSSWSFVNGTANGLTCFLPLGSDQLAWPYGGGQVNSRTLDESVTGTANGTSTSTSAGTGSSTSQTAATSSGSTQSSAAGDRAKLPATAVIGVMTMLAGVGVGAVLAL
ncbi:hypothetical protein BCR39DRAFT_542550 [Naematelia encephala]|uniref:Uncharacterized protein n=1 Tax=Naematelia encephala TaxID=71784 RepID=A0A1Y2ATM8_9TREE|nr:hypothetical protein BCR39DRAFT_542550 [Naematelia encephala]